MQNTIITFIGAGNMGHSLIGGLIATGCNPKNIWATDANAEKLVELQKQFGINATQDNLQAASQANVIILAVKPQILKKVATGLAETIKQKQPLVITIAAGIPEPSLRAWLNDQVAIVRCMPNMPALVRCGATGLYANKQVTTAQKKLAESILNAVGITVWLADEHLLDVVTAISGSGPAYFFQLMEILEKTATEMGLPAEAAHQLTVQTALGSARMALESVESPTVLRERVTSPGGTTEHALKVLNAKKIHLIFADALRAAKQRATELAHEFGK